MDRIGIMLKLHAEARRSAATQQDISDVSPSNVLAKLSEGLPGRNATSRFLPESMRVEELRRACEAMSHIDRTLWKTSAHDAPLRILVAIRAVEDLDHGLFEFVGGVLELIDLEGKPFEVAEMVLQPEFADAAAIILVIGPLATGLAQSGAHGHRTLLTRAGAACEAAWLSVVRDGLTGSIFAGFLPSGIREVAGIDGFNDTQLLALALGHGVSVPDSTASS